MSTKLSSEGADEGEQDQKTDAKALISLLTPLVEKQIPDTPRSRGISEEQVRRDVLLASQPTKKFVTVEQVARLVQFLCSPGADSITGAVLPIEGGWTAH